MRELAEALRNRQSNEFDANFMVDGPRGNGKSTFIWKLLTEVGNFHPRQDIVFSRADLMKCLKRKFTCIMADEMINSAHNRDFYAGQQKELIKMFNMYRDNFNILGGAVPFFYDLDPQVRKFIKMRITVIDRGVAVVQFARSSLYSNDPWETQINQKIEMKWVNNMQKGIPTKPNYRRLSTFKGYVHYGPMSKTDSILYKKLKEEKRNNLMETEKEEKGNAKNERYDALYNMLKRGELRTDHITALSVGLGINKNSLFQALKVRLVKEGLGQKVSDLIVGTE